MKLSEIVRQAANPKMIDMYDVFQELDEWLGMRWNDWDKLKGPGVSTSAGDKLYKLYSKAYKGYAKRDQLVIPLQEAREYQKMLRAYLKNLGQYGGVPAQLKASKEAIKSVIDHLAYAMKHPEDAKSTASIDRGRWVGKRDKWDIRVNGKKVTFSKR